MLKSIISNLHKSWFFGKIFHTLDFCLCQELRDCKSVLDLGCGPSSPIKGCKNVTYSVGVEIFEPYLARSKAQNIHNKYINKKIEDLDFKDASFDAVILVEVLEHLDKASALIILEKAQRWASKKIIVTSPNGFVPQAAVDKNPYQKHLSGWNYKELKELGFKSWGLAGLACLRTTKEDNDSMDDNLLVSIKYKPKFFWFVIATLSQLFTYYFPKRAFELFSVRKIT